MKDNKVKYSILCLLMIIDDRSAAIRVTSGLSSIMKYNYMMRGNPDTYFLINSLKKKV